MSVRSLARTLASVTCVAAAFAGNNWTPTGGPGGGLVTVLASSDGADYVGTRGGAFRSIDGGQHWSEITAAIGGVVDVTAIGVTGDSILLATADAEIRRSNDGGGTWESLPSPSPGFAFQQFAFHESRVYAVIADTQTGGGLLGSLWFSDDFGSNWMQISNVGFPLHAVFVDDDMLLVSANNPSFGFFPILRRSVDGGATWATVGSSPGSTLAPFSFFAFLDTVRVGTDLFLSAEGEAIYRSTDNGLNWSRAGYPAGSALQNVQLTASDGTLYFSGFRRDDGTTEVGPGIWKSSTLGASWTRADTGLSEPFNLMKDLSASGAYLLIGGITGLFRSPDAGASWSRSDAGVSAAFVYAMSSGPTRLFANVVNTPEIWRNDAGGWHVASNGFSGVVLGIGALSDDVAFVGSQTEGIRRSIDGGLTFQPVNSGIPRYNGTAGLQYREVESFAFTSTAIFAGVERGLQQIPGSQGFQISGAGVLRSLDGGSSWTIHHTGFPVIGSDNFGNPLYPPILCLVADDGAVYAGTYFRGIYRSANNGLSWNAVNSGLPPLATGVFPLVLALAEFDGEYFAALESGYGVYRSADGVSWSPCSAGLPTSGDATSLAELDGALHVGLTLGDPGTPTVYRLDPGTCTWTPTGQIPGGIDVWHLAANDRGLFAATTTRSVWQFAGPPPCLGDIDGDRAIGLSDLSALLGAFGSCVGDAAFLPAADFDGSNCVDLTDLTTLLGVFGTSCD